MIKIRIKARKGPVTLDRIKLTQEDIGRKVICIETHGCGCSISYDPSHHIIKKGKIYTIESLEENWAGQENNEVLALEEDIYVRQRKFWAFYEDKNKM